MFQHESNIIAAVIARRKFLPKHTGDFMFVRVAGIVKGAVYTRLGAFVPRFENVSSDGIGHCCHLCSGGNHHFSADDKAEDTTNGNRRREAMFSEKARMLPILRDGIRVGRTDQAENTRRFHLVSRLSHFSTCGGRHSSSARNNSAGDSRASTSARFSGFRNRSSTAWSNIVSNGL